MNNGSLTISSKHFELDLDTCKGGWSLDSSSGEFQIEDACIEIAWLRGGEVSRTNLLEEPEDIEAGHTVSLPKGSRAVCVQKSVIEQVRFFTDIALHDRDPLCFFRVRVENLSGEPIHLLSVNYFGRRSAAVSTHRDRSSSIPIFTGSRTRLPRFFGQGWQSWSVAGVLGPDERFPRSKLGPLSGPMQLCWGLNHPSKPGRFISDFYGALIDHQTNTGMLLGFLSQTYAFGRLEVELNHPVGVRALWQDLESVRIPVGDTFSSDWACIHELKPHQSNPLDPYLAAVSSANGIGQLKDPVSGWCSWYCYGQDISLALLDGQVQWMSRNRERLPLGLFLIDDGYQQNIGDWQQDTHRFPESLSRLSSEIKAHSFDAGIWMAPLVSLARSELAKNNPEWLLRDQNGKAVNAGFGWGQFFHALDGSHPGVRRELKKWIERVVSDWGFDFIKLDFLYAGALSGKRYDDTKTGAMVLREVLTDIRSVAGEDTFLVGCGCPLGSGLGVVDSMRISPDVSEHWRGRYKGISLLVNRDPGFPSAWNAIRNTYFRAHQHGHWWLNDPDCLILRDDQTKLSEIEARTLATMVSLCGGAVIDSDELSSLADDRAAMLARLLPPINMRPAQPTLFCPDRPPLLIHRFIGAIGEWSLIAIFNFEESKTEAVVERAWLGFEGDEDLIGFDYWDQRTRMFRGGSWKLGDIPPHGVRLWALRKAADGVAWVGDSIHISQGLCVSEWDIEGRKLRARVSSGRVGEEKIWLRIPGNVMSVSVDHEPVPGFIHQDDILSFEIQLSTLNLMEVHWN